MDKKKNFPMNIGLSSILLIFVVLCLVSFSILSIVSANADKKLSLKVLNRSIAYYNACNEAETTLRDVDETASHNILQFGRYQFLSCQYLHFRADLSLPNFRFTGT